MNTMKAQHVSSTSLGRRSLLIGGLCLPLGLRAQAATPPPEVAVSLPKARLLGSGSLRFFGFHVYDARLWSTAEFRPADYSSEPLALELEYGRTLYGKSIAERSLEEMQKLGEIAAPRAQSWLMQMSRIFPDVGKNDRITGLQRPGESASFFFNAKPIGEIRDSEFTRLFFGIWLSPRSPEPQLREALLGASRRGS